ncbi:hypothetical protein KIPB_012380, partial [Kipferlia bialata]|eukprot:g12380.t1
MAAPGSLSPYLISLVDVALDRSEDVSELRQLVADHEKYPLPVDFQRQKHQYRLQGNAAE